LLNIKIEAKSHGALKARWSKCGGKVAIRRLCDCAGGEGLLNIKIEVLASKSLLSTPARTNNFYFHRKIKEGATSHTEYLLKKGYPTP
jgi:hypothetical protein